MKAHVNLVAAYLKELLETTPAEIGVASVPLSTLEQE